MNLQKVADYSQKTRNFLLVLSAIGFSTLVAKNRSLPAEDIKPFAFIPLIIAAAIHNIMLELDLFTRARKSPRHP